MIQEGKRYIPIVMLAGSLLLLSCSSEPGEEPAAEEAGTIEATTDLVIGLEDQPLEYQLGQPIAVRTDDEGHIYIADRASMEIKVFDRDGNYLHSLGGRGRGPGEFHDMEFMEWTSEGHLVLMDRGNLRYIVISTDGEEIASYPYNMADQFYPQALTYLEGHMLALFHNSSPYIEIPEFERDLFYIYSTDFQERKASFMPVNRLGHTEMFPVTMLGRYAGSFALTENNSILVFSPGNYTGLIYVFRKRQAEQWEFDRTIRGREPGIDSYHVYTSESQYNRALDSGMARATQVHSAGEIYWGSQLSMDAGLFSLGDGRLVHFYAEWKEGYERFPGSMSNPMDLYVQVFGPDGELEHHGYLLTFIERFTMALHSVVNWMDERGNFYMLDHPDEIPVVRRFSLDLPERESLD
jgi:hypothetical protein